ncbi:hypothetical protein [Marinoscillum sp.]|uniref:hypothetical protein n=1 Tax=Marinoscillum sp. TaxID=2024838 RepID=UPI003BABFECA
MRSNYIIICTLAVMLIGCAPSDLDGPNPGDVFVKYYGQGANEAIDIVRTSTNETIILAQNTLSDNSNFYLIKTDDNGNEIDSRLIDLNDGSNDIPRRLKPVGNDEFLIVGYMQFEDEFGVDQFTGVWGRINSDLETISTDSTGAAGFNYLDSMIAVDIIQTSDSNPTYIVLGHSSVESRRYAGDVTPVGDFQIYMGKHDDNDSVYWEKSHGFSGNEEALSIFEVTGGDLLVVGMTKAVTSAYSGDNLYILQTNEFGTPDGGGLVTGIPGAADDADDRPYAVKKSSLGYSIVGATEATENGGLRGFHIAVSNEGQLVTNSSNVLSNDYNLNCRALTFSRTLNNELMVLGSIPNFTLSSGDGGSATTKLEEILVMKVSPISGHIEGFDQNYGTTVGNDRAKAAVTLPDGDVLVAATIDFGSGTTMVGLLRLNDNGELKD